jgi:hypothetical protein
MEPIRRRSVTPDLIDERGCSLPPLSAFVYQIRGISIGGYDVKTRWTAVAIISALLLAVIGLYAQTDLQQKLRDTGVGAHWIYDDFQQAVAQAQAANQPILALFR